MRTRPQTPLPWLWQKLGERHHLVSQSARRPIVLTALPATGIAVRHATQVRLVPLYPAHPDAAYLEEAANRYPAVVEALRELARQAIAWQERAGREGVGMDAATQAALQAAAAALADEDPCETCDGAGATRSSRGEPDGPEDPCAACEGTGKAAWMVGL